MTIRASLRRLDWNAVLAENLHRSAVDRFALLDRDQENIAAAIGISLRQNSNVGDEKESPVPDRGNRFFCDWIPAARGQEEKAALTPAVGRFAQLLGKLERRIICFPLVFERNRLLLHPDPR